MSQEQCLKICHLPSLAVVEGVAKSAWACVKGKGKTAPFVTGTKNKSVNSAGCFFSKGHGAFCGKQRKKAKKKRCLSKPLTNSRFCYRIIRRIMAKRCPSPKNTGSFHGHHIILAPKNQALFLEGACGYLLLCTNDSAAYRSMNRDGCCMGKRCVMNGRMRACVPFLLGGQPSSGRQAFQNATN